MAVTKCRECGGKLASSAKTCPHCGGRVKRIGVLGWLFLIFFVFPTVWAIILGITADTESSGGQASRQAAATHTPASSTTESRGSELVKEHCVKIGEFAKSAMTKRQAGTLMTEIQTQNDAILESIVIAAYEKPRFLGGEYIAREIADFHNEIYLKCIKGRF